MKRSMTLATGVLAGTVALTGCLGGASSNNLVVGRSMAAVAETTNLKDVCPATIVVQTDWHAEAEHGLLYNLLGPNPVIDKEHARITSELVVGAKDSGVKLEIREGGPADFVLVHGDPTSDPSALWRVWRVAWS